MSADFFIPMQMWLVGAVLTDSPTKSACCIGVALVAMFLGIKDAKRRLSVPQP